MNNETFYIYNNGEFIAGITATSKKEAISFIPAIFWKKGIDKGKVEIEKVD